MQLKKYFFMRYNVIFLIIFLVANISLKANFGESNKSSNSIDNPKLITDLEIKIKYLQVLIKKSNHEKLAYSAFLQLQKQAKLLSLPLNYPLLYQQAESQIEFLENSSNQEALKSIVDKFDALIITKIIACDYQIKQLQNS